MPPPLNPTNTGRIPFWWDMLVVAVFSLAIYYWAMATRLPRRRCSTWSSGSPASSRPSGARPDRRTTSARR